jgi:hypothetical protein
MGRAFFYWLKPWLSARVGRMSGFRGNKSAREGFFRSFGAGSFLALVTHGLRRGLRSVAASRLKAKDGRPMKFWEKFKTYKERGEWVELQFMAEAARRRFAVCKPWGEVRAYDVGIEVPPNFLRVQVKSTSCRRGDGYCCQLIPNHAKKQDYSLEEVDLFAAYVIPLNAWYLIPASLVLGERRITCVMLSPVGRPTKEKSYCYERYKEAWGLLKNSRADLARYGDEVQVRKPPGSILKGPAAARGSSIR